jgi:RND family efflux transporter MFP subunit
MADSPFSEETMKSTTIQPVAEPLNSQFSSKSGVKFWAGAAVVMAIVGSTIALGPRLAAKSSSPAAPPPPSVTLSAPLQKGLSDRLQFLGQFSAVDRVDLRAQVGGTLTQIGFKDGDIVHKGDFLFEIDPTPYEIKLSEATARLASTHARLDLASQELARAETLKRTDAGTSENVEQRAAEQRTAQATVDEAEALVRDARFDLDRCYITAPFTGRIGSHQVSVGNLVSGSRAGNGPTTLLATLVSLNPIYLNFDMSEADYMAFLREREKQKGPLADRVDASLSDETSFTRQGTLNFVDNSLDRSSGTIHARATMPNADLLLTPGGFARIRLALSTPAQILLVPDASVLADQSDHIVLTVGPDNVVIPKKVQLGDLRYGLRVIRSGLASSDRVVIDGIPIVTPGSKVLPHDGSIRLDSDEGKN